MAGEVKWVDLPLSLDWTLAKIPYDTVNIVYDGLIQSTETTMMPSSCKIASRLVNWFPTKGAGGEVILRAREILAPYPVIFGKGGTVTTPRGLIWLPAIKFLVECWDTTLYVQTASATYNTATVGATTGGPIGACEGVNLSGNRYGFISERTKSYTMDTAGAITQVSDGDFPATTSCTPVYMDSYVFVAQFNTRKIFNSAVGDPTSWAASTYIETEQFGGNVVGLVRHHDMVVALCENSVEFFRDAAVPAPNSPLQRVAEKASLIGCVGQATIATYGDVTYFAGIDRFSNFGIYKLENYQITKISTPSIDVIVKNFCSGGRVYGVISSFALSSHPTAYLLPFNGQLCYVFVTSSQPSNGSSGGTTYLTRSPSFAYDTTTNLWIEIANEVSNSSKTVPVCGGGWSFPYGCRISSAISGGTTASILLMNSYGGSTHGGIMTFDDDSGSAEQTDVTGGYTSSTNTPCIIQWPLNDFKYVGRKHLSGIYIADGGWGNNAIIANTNMPSKFIRYGQYVEATASPVYLTRNLTDQLAITPASGERVWVSRAPEGQFYQNWFLLQQTLRYVMGLNRVSLRITTGDEI